MNNQVVSLEIAEELRDKLNDIEGGAFYWHVGRRTKYNKWGEWSLLEAFHVKYRNNCKGNVLDKYVPAYTLTEMLEMLPEYVDMDLNGYGIKTHRLTLFKNQLCYAPVVDGANISLTLGNLIWCIPKDVNTATVAGQAMIWLIDNGHIGENR